VPATRRSSGRPPPPGTRQRNHLLAALPAADLRAFLPRTRTISIEAQQVLHHARHPLRHVYFPTSGVFSITTELSDGTHVETSSVGDEGMAGIEAFFGDDPLSFGETRVQVPGTHVLEMSVGDFRRAMRQHRSLRRLMAKYVVGVLGQTMQSAACCAAHRVLERCARWLLTTHDRMHRREFRLSHEALALMVGAQRPTVSTAARRLQAAGLIRYTHGRVSVLDRTGLKKVACGCYTEC
jgi:CRP-like cAMP-binding protein